MMYYSEDLTYLMIPGPVEIHPRVYKAMNEHVFGHRTAHFRSILQQVTEGVQQVFGTSNPVAIMAGSGTLGLHVALSNVLRKNDEVLCFVNGKFSERQANIVSAFGIKPIIKEIPYGEPVLPEHVKEALETHPDIALTTVCHNETSTGVLSPLKEISAALKGSNSLLSADGITSAAGDYVFMDDWGVDLFVSGSQKCFGLPPGLAFISHSSKADERMNDPNGFPTFYDSIPLYSAGIKKGWDAPFTPPIGLVYGLQESLNIMFEEGLENRIKRHHKMGEAFRSAFLAMGLTLLAQENYYSNTVTTANLPETVNSSEFSSIVREMGILIAGGQGHLKGKIFRVGHMNLVGPREVLMTVSVIEHALRKVGYNFSPGSGVTAASNVLM